MIFLAIQFILAIQMICSILNGISGFVFQMCGTILVIVTICINMFSDDDVSMWKTLEILLSAVVLFMIPNIIEYFIAQSSRITNKLNQISQSL